MICPRPDCQALVSEDREFTVQMLSYGLPQRRYVCTMGHSQYTDVPSAPHLIREVLPGGRPARTVSHLCNWCGEAFTGITRQKYCSRECTRSVDAERSRQRIAADKTRLSPEALKQARAIPASWNHPHRALVGYAPRPKNLSKAWV